MNFLNIFFQSPLFYFFLVWSLVWKGLALWRAAKNNHLVWFIVLLVVNTLGILEIVYLLIIGKKQKKPQPL